jgi:hypothetical protein
MARPGKVFQFFQLFFFLVFVIQKYFRLKSVDLKNIQNLKFMNNFQFDNFEQFQNHFKFFKFIPI